MYRVIDTKIWTDPKVKKLSTEGKLVFAYLVTNQSTHLSGLYTLPKVMVSYELTLSDRVLDRVFQELDTLSLAYFDPETDTVFVQNMFRYQGKGEKNQRSAANQLDNVHNSFLIQAFLDEYPEAKQFVKDRVLDRVCDRGSYRNRNRTGTEQDIIARSSVEQSGPEDSEPVLKIPLVTKGAEFSITQEMVDRWVESYPALNVIQELRNCREWNFANKKNRKTKSGILKHITGWLSRAQNKAGKVSAACNGGDGPQYQEFKPEDLD